MHLQSSKVVPGDANARRLRSSSLSLVTWRSWNKIVSRLSPDGRLSLMAGGGEDASPLTGDPATVSTLPEAGTIVQHTLEKFLRSNIAYSSPDANKFIFSYGQNDLSTIA